MTQLYFEDVEPGTEVAHEVRMKVTIQDLVKWAGAVGDYTPIHYDKDSAQGVGLPGPIVHGPLKCALLARLMTEWIGEQGTLHKLSCRHTAMNSPGETLVCKGRVIRKYVEVGENLAECEVWVENQDGRGSASGKATVSLPRRRNKAR